MRRTLKRLGFELTVFLLGVLAARTIHLVMMGSVATSMSVTMAAEARAVLSFGLGNAFLEKPPLAVLFLSTAASIMQVAPAHALPVVILATHLVLGLAFWFWVRSLRLRPAVRRTSLLIFVGLPLFNSYEGFDNYPTLLGAALFLVMAACLMRCGTECSRKWPLVLGAICTWSIMLVRLEYLVLWPVYVALYFAFRWLLNGHVPSRRELTVALLFVMSLVAGAVTTKAFRYFDAEDFALAPNTYSCTTFLQGVPEAWLEPEDWAQGDWGREACGIRYFGHPEEYDYSVGKIVLHHPRLTIEKALLNLPRWCFQLGRRHVVVPLPVTGLMIIGLITVTLHFRRNRRFALLPILLATIAMTLALTATVVNAEYMVPAYAALIVLAAHGLVWSAQSIDLSICRSFGTRRVRGTAWWVCIVAFVVLTELLYFRGGGNLPDAMDMRGLAELVDQQMGRSQQRSLVLDPPDSGVEAFSQSDFWNRWLEYKWLRSQDTSATGPLYSMPPPSELVSSQPALYKRLDLAIIWASGVGSDRASEKRLENWEKAGFQRSGTDTTEDRFGRAYTIFVMRRNGETRR